MNKDLLLQIFQAPYNRQSFIDNVLLPTFQGKVDNLEIYDEYGAQEVDLTVSEEQYAKSAMKYGQFTTSEEIGRTVEMYEVILHDHKQLERSRVGIAALIKKQIIGNNAVLVNFAYENPQNRSWRFSFIAHDAVFFDGEMVQSETNPKRYTYVFGEPDETYRTALERFYTLGHEYSITVESLKDAFGVEAMSKAFFDEYRDIHYNGFVDYLTRSNFKQSVFNGDEKAIRDFVKKLLGRIVFLYFIQKKGWLGASNGNYTDGDKNFMTNFYKKAGANEAFYSIWLSKLFFDTLNNPRPNDAFEMPDGTSVMIPYLNGGLFEKDSNKYDFLTFPADLFSDLFEFFDQYNFTIYEDSPEEHTVAVDPEMLGHIFENLLEDNKDKGAFYTPKEIVHYMTQESLIEYLHTQIPDANRNELEAFVKNKDNSLSNQYKQQIDQKLDSVKICDPAIGSGAFPMGLLQEIFGMKERIAFELGYTVWSPATVKEHIIQNSIYGVDIEQGAVDIARLRFWLSLIVDEEMPKALPNLDYKIVVGNSLVSEFEDEIIEIDWSNDTTSGGLFGQEIIAEKTKLLQTISEKQKDFFTADNDSKPILSAAIRKLKLEILEKQLELMIETKGAKRESNALGKPSKKQVERYLETQGWKRALSIINKLKSNDKPFMHFDWKLDFPEVLNPLATESKGFDIVIGNPPYVSAVTMKRSDFLKALFKKKYPEVSGSYDLYVLFLLLALDILKSNGHYSWIIPNKFLIADYAKNTRVKLSANGLYSSLNVSSFNVFKGVGVYPIIISGSNSNTDIGFSEYYLEHYSDLENRLFQKVKELPEYTLLKDFGVRINSGATGFQAKELKKWVDSEASTESIPFTVSGNVDRYIYNNCDVQFMKERYSKAFVSKYPGLAESKWTFWSSPKIVVAGMTKVIEAVYVENPLGLGVGVYGIYDFGPFEPYALTAILNSKYLSYYFRNKFKDKHLAGGYLAINKSTIESFPLVELDELSQRVLSNLSYYLHFINNLEAHSTNKALAEEFEEVIDSIVFELYFTEEFQSKEIEIAKYAKEMFVPIKGLSEEEKFEQIKSGYEALREKKNPLRNQIKLMKIELKDLLLPILSV